MLLIIMTKNVLFYKGIIIGLHCRINGDVVDIKWAANIGVLHE